MARTIRPATADDASSIARIYAPFVTDKATSFEAVAPTAEQIVVLLTTLEPKYPWLVFDEDEVVRGYADAGPHSARHAYQWSVNVSVYLDPSVHRRGIGRTLYLALFDLLKRQGYVNAYAGITVPNQASEGLHAAFGFEPVGIYRGVGFKLGRWHDVIWLHLRLRDDAVPVDTPRPTSELWRSRV